MALGGLVPGLCPLPPIPLPTPIILNRDTTPKRLFPKGLAVSLVLSVSLHPPTAEPALLWREMKKCHSKGTVVGKGGTGVRSCGAFLPHLA